MEVTRAHRIQVTSSAIRSVAYFEEDGSLEIEFGSGLVYRYDGVPRGTVAGLLEASSKGRYFNLHVRNTFPGSVSSSGHFRIQTSSSAA